MTDIEVLAREIQCVHRKAQINCTNCGSCDLLMDDKRILEAYANAIAALHARQEAEKNEPLTLEELRQMDGQPVWVEWQTCGGMWALVCMAFQSVMLANTHSGKICEEDYRKTWLAYRRPPEAVAQ